MARPDENIKNLYNAFVEMNYEVGTEEDFAINLTAPENRRAVYDAYCKEYEAPPFNVFESRLGYGNYSMATGLAGSAVGARSGSKVQRDNTDSIEHGAEAPAQGQASGVDARVAFPHGSEEPYLGVALGVEASDNSNADAGRAEASALEQINEDAVGSLSPGFDSFGTEQNDGAEFKSSKQREFEALMEASAIKEDVKPERKGAPALQLILDAGQMRAQAGFDRLARQGAYTESGSFFGGGLKEDGYALDADGNVVRRFMTPLGSTGNKAQAALERELELPVIEYFSSMTTGGQLANERKRLNELTRKRNELQHELTAEYSDRFKLKDNPFLTYTPTNIGDLDPAHYTMHPEYRQLQAAIRQSEERIAKLERTQDVNTGKDVGFWRGFADVVTDYRTWTLTPGLVDAVTAYGIKGKLDRGEKLTATEQSLLSVMADNAATGDVDNMWYSAGVMGGYMPKFMLDIALIGGADAAAWAFTNRLTEGMLRQLPKQVSNKITRWAVKAAGATPEMLARGAILANTVQAPKTAADVVNRRMGTAEHNEKGNVEFVDGASWASALYQAEGDAIVEGASEMSGRFIEPALKGVAKRLFNGKAITAAIAAADRNGLRGMRTATDRFLQHFGFNGIFGEIGEEYAGQLARTIGGLDGAYDQSGRNNFLNLKWHRDIWVGMALTMPLISAAPATFNAGRYGWLRHRVNRADARGNALMGERWDAFRAEVDQTDNSNMQSVLGKVLDDDATNNEQKIAQAEYIESTLNLRGFNLGEMADARTREAERAEAENERYYLQGLNASASERSDIDAVARAKALSLLGALGVDVSALSEASTNDIIYQANTELHSRMGYADVSDMREARALAEEKLTPDVAVVALDYLKASEVQRGAARAVEYEIDEAVAAQVAFIDLCTASDGMIHQAVMTDGTSVFVRRGTLKLSAEGNVDRHNSDRTLIVVDVNGRARMISPLLIKTASMPVSADESKAAIAEIVRRQLTSKSYPPRTSEATEASSSAGNSPQTASTTKAAQTQAPSAGVANAGFDIGDEVQLGDGRRGVIQGIDNNGASTRYTVETTDADGNPQVVTVDGSGMTAAASTTNGAEAPAHDQMANDTAVAGGAEVPVREQNSEVASALSRIPVDEQGQLKYDEADPDTAWDAIVEQAQGDEATAAEVVADIVSECEEDFNAAEKALNKTKEGKPKKRKKDDPAPTMAERIAAKNAAKEALAEAQAIRDRAKAILDHWKKIAGTKQRREAERRSAEDTEARRRAEERAAEEARLRAEREEAERIEREAHEAWERERRRFDKDLRDTADALRESPIALEILGDTAPATIDEVASIVLSRNKVIWSDEMSRTGTRLITGARTYAGLGNAEFRKLYGLWASKANGGMSIDRLAEDVFKEICDEYGVTYDNGDALNALIDVIRSSNTRSDIVNYIKRRRIEQARQYYEKELEADVAALEQACFEAYGMSRAERMAYEEMLAEEAENAVNNFDESEYLSNIADEIAERKIAQRNNINNGLNRKDENGHAEGEKSDDAGGRAVLPRPRISRTEGAGANENGQGISIRNGQEVSDTSSALAGATSAGTESDSEQAAVETQTKAGTPDKEEVKEYAYDETMKAYGARGTLSSVKNGVATYVNKKGEPVIILCALSDESYVGFFREDGSNRWSSKMENNRGKEAQRSMMSRATAALPEGAELYEHTNVSVDGLRVFAQQLKHGWKIGEDTYECGLNGTDLGNILGPEHKDDGNFTDVTWRISELEQLRDILEPYLTPLGVGREAVRISRTSKDEGVVMLRLPVLRKMQTEQHDFDDLDNTALAERIDVADDDWTEGEGQTPTYKRTITIDGKHKVIQVDEPDGNGFYTGSHFEYKGEQFGSLTEVIDVIDKHTQLAADIAEAEAEVNTDPTPSQKEAGNYKKGHVQVGTFDVTIEQPVGSVRRGTDAVGKEWETTMQNTYGYIRGTEGVDGDHIDVFLSDNIDGWNGRRVVIVDQYNPDGTFDEHKVMLGFNDKGDAVQAYLNNYEKGWENGRRLVFTTATLEDFEKWIESSHRKQKPYHEYKIAEKAEVEEIKPENSVSSLSSRLAQIREGKAVVSENGDVQIEREMYDWRHRGEYKLSVPKSKQRGGIYTMNPDLLKLVDGHNFITKGNSMIAYVAEADIAKVVDMLSRAPFNLTIVEESKLTDVSAEDDVLMRAMWHSDDFSHLQQRAVAERGIVMPGLNEAEVRVVDVPRHDFAGSGKEALQAAEAWAKDNIVGIHTATDSEGSTFEYSISNDAVEKYVSRSATAKSDNIGVHLAALKKLPEIIAESIEAEVHADYKKQGGVRGTQSEVNPQSLVHRFYGAVDIEGKIYRVKTTMREYSDLNMSMVAHSYEVTQMELLEAPSDNTLGTDEPLAMTSNSSISAAKLLKGVEKSYDKGKYLLDESEFSEGKAIAEEQRQGSDSTKAAAQEQITELERPSQSNEAGAEYVPSSESDARSAGITVRAEELKAQADVFAENYNSRAVAVVVSVSDIENEELSDVAKRELIKVLENGNTPACYSVENKKIYIFASAQENDMGTDYILFHENVHAVIDDMAEYPAEKLNALAEAIVAANPILADDYNRTVTEYGRQYANEEFIAYVLSSVVVNPAWIKRLLKHIDNNITSFAYDIIDQITAVAGRNTSRFSKPLYRAVQPGASRGRGASDRNGEPDTAGADAEGGTDAEGRGLSGTDARSARTTVGEMADHVEELASKLHLDKEQLEIVTDASQLEGKQAKAKGFYNKRSGKITIVIPNHVSRIDVEQTLLHEAVAHYGLRKLFGEHFNTFLDNVYQSTDESIRRRIAEMAAKNGWDFRTATEEYLAGLAEDTNFSEAQSYTGWWSKIKRLFLDMLDKIGFEGFSAYCRAAMADNRDKVGVVLTDNELRYILWRSYENLAEPGRYRSILGEAADVAKQSELKVGNYAEQGIEAEYAAEPENTGIINERFNNELSQYENGTLPKGHRFELGMPSQYLRSAGFPNLPISMRSSLLARKAGDEKHPFEASDIKGLVEAIQKPIAIFEYTKSYMRNLIVDVTRGDKHFLVGVTLNYKAGDIEINSVSGLFPKESHEWVKWIQDGKAIRIDQKEKVQKIIDSLRTNPAESERIGLNLDDVAKVVNSFENPTLSSENNADAGDDVLYRTAREEYDMKVRTVAVHDEYGEKIARDSDGKKMKPSIRRRLHEAYFDSMASLKILQDVISKESKKPIEEYENAYWAENRMSSMNRAQTDRWKKMYFEPIINAVTALAKGQQEYRDLLDYMIAKHGLERNAVMRMQALADGKNGDRDFAGLTALTNHAPKDWQPAEADARALVRNYEGAHSTEAIDNFWAAIRAATRSSLQTRYEAGLITKEVYTKLQTMYDYYIPLKGWKDITAGDMYEYAAGSYAMGSALHGATGRESIADDPLATIGVDGELTIREANRNRMKQHLLNLAINHRSTLLTVGRQWYVYDAQANGYVEVDAPIKPEYNADEIAACVEQFNQDMKQKEAQGLAFRSRVGLQLGLPIKPKEYDEHIIKVKRAGKTYCIYLNGDPRAAQAVNGILNPDNADHGRVHKTLQDVKNTMARLFTSYNPSFVATNLARDLMFASIAVAAKEGHKYNAQYQKNINALFWETTLAAPLSATLTNEKNMWQLVHLYNANRLDMNDARQRYFHEFMSNGGETGFTEVNRVDDVRKDIQRYIKDANGGTARQIAMAGKKTLEAIEYANRCIEDMSRFAVYMTSRQQGRSIAESVWDAKEITVNFNKKGSGEYGARAMNFLYIFFNAAIQATANVGRIIKRHPVRAGFIGASFLASGFLAPMLNTVIGQLFCGDGDDDDKYGKLPEWVRRNNLVLRIPFTDRFFTYPLPHELRPLYGCGEIGWSVMNGKEELEEGFLKAAEGFTGVLPIDFTGNGGNVLVNITPTALQPISQVIANVDYFGKPIYRDTPFNKDNPEWSKAYKSTLPFLVEASRLVSEAGATVDEYGVVHYPESVLTGDINPAIVQHLFESYLGGTGKFFSDAARVIESIGEEEGVNWRRMPIVNKFIQSADEQSKEVSLRNRYFRAKDGYDKLQNEYRAINRQKYQDGIDYAGNKTRFLKSPEGQLYVSMKRHLDKINALKSHIDRAKSAEDALKYETDMANHQEEFALKYETFKDISKR